MKIVVFTGNTLRHKYIANTLVGEADDMLVVSECTLHASAQEDAPAFLREHFTLREEIEKSFFEGHDAFWAAAVPILYKEANTPFVCEIIKKYKPDAGFVFGSSIIREPLLSLIPSGKFINLHLGLAPYYRGSGTNFWPFVNRELEYVGATLLHIDAGIDTGDIIAHVRPTFEIKDTAHTAGCKTITESAHVLLGLLKRLESGETLPRIPQWKVSRERVYKTKDFTESVLKKYYENINTGLVGEYLVHKRPEIELISL